MYVLTLLTFASFVSIVSIVSIVSVDAREQADCTTAAQCRELTLAAIAEKDFERAHDLAWRVFQVSKGNAEAMALLARAQSLSGRGDDAFVMLQRLAAAGGKVEDADTSDDFRRVREHARWAELRAALAGDRGDIGGKGAAAPAAPVPPVTPLPPALSLPAALPTPGAFAYDAVSARFILADAASDVLRVLSQNSGNATTLVSAGWSGHSTITAVAINRRNGDMWVTAQGETTSALHRFQLVSGRLLETFSSPDDAGLVRLTAVAVTADAVFVLDAAGHRIFVLATGNKTLRGFAALPKTIAPIGLAHSGAALFVSHATGLLRIDVASRVAQPVTLPTDGDGGDLHSIEWHQNSLLAIRQEPSGARVVRARLNTRGTTVTAIDVIQPARTTAGALAGDDYYFLSEDEADAGLAFRSVPARAASAPRSPPKR